MLNVMSYIVVGNDDDIPSEPDTKTREESKPREIQSGSGEFILDPRLQLMMEHFRHATLLSERQSAMTEVATFFVKQHKHECIALGREGIQILTEGLVSDPKDSDLLSVILSDVLLPAVQSDARNAHMMVEVSCLQHLIRCLEGARELYLRRACLEILTWCQRLDEVTFQR